MKGMSKLVRLQCWVYVLDRIIIKHCHSLICCIFFSLLRMQKIMVHLIIDGILDSMKYSRTEQMFLSLMTKAMQILDTIYSITFARSHAGPFTHYQRSVHLKTYNSSLCFALMVDGTKYSQGNLTPLASELNLGKSIKVFR